MFRSIVPTLSKKYAAPEEDLTSKTTVQPKRRALGDITNNTAISEEVGDGAKKPLVVIKSTLDKESESKDDLDGRPYMQRASDDIDARDAGNPLLATCYVNEMYDFFNNLEREMKVSPSYMTNQNFINERMRAILIDWLVEVHLKFKMVPETFYLTVNIIDRFLEVKEVRRSRLQLVGVAALLIASKYEEIYPPELRDLVYITDKAYNKQEIVAMENDIVNTLNYNFTLPTVHSFLCRYLKAAHADRAMVQLSCYIAERTMQDYSMLQFLPSTVAATAVYIARKSLSRHPWSPTLVKYTKHDEVDLAACNDEIKAILNNTANEQQAVFRKYSSTKFGSVAKTPLVF